MCDGTSSYISNTWAVISSFQFCGNNSKPMKQSRQEGRNPAKHPLAKGIFRGRTWRRWSLSQPSAPQPHLIREIWLPFDFLPAAGLNSLSYTHLSLQPASAAFHFILPPECCLPARYPAHLQRWEREGSQQGHHIYLSSLLKPEKGEHTCETRAFINLLPQLNRGMSCVLHVALRAATQNWYCMKLNACLQADTFRR